MSNWQIFLNGIDVSNEYSDPDYGGVIGNNFTLYPQQNSHLPWSQPQWNRNQVSLIQPSRQQRFDHEAEQKLDGAYAVDEEYVPSLTTNIEEDISSTDYDEEQYDVEGGEEWIDTSDEENDDIASSTMFRFGSTSLAAAGPSMGAAAASWADQSLVAELLDALDDDANNVEARRLLMEQYLLLDWTDAAVDQGKEILRIQPGDPAAAAIVAAYGEEREAISPPQNSTSKKKAKASNKAATKKKVEVGSKAATPSSTRRSLPADVKSVQQLKKGYESLREEAETLCREITIFQTLAPHLDMIEQVAELSTMMNTRKDSGLDSQVENHDVDDHVPWALSFWGKDVGAGKSTTARAAGKKPMRSGSLASGPSIRSLRLAPLRPNPQSAKSLATAMRSNTSRAFDACMNDFTEYVTWYRSSNPGIDNDALRKSIQLRASVTTPSLPAELSHIPSTALMHIEHEQLGKTYQNSETMLGDSIAEIPRENFLVTDDGYAWDVSELVSALTATNSTMRNPLSRDPFSVSDIEAIIRHPLGSVLQAAHLEQAQLKNGVRPETVKRMRQLSAILLADNSETSHPSHTAADEFLTYIATLPAAERKAIDTLKVPAIDSHTGQRFEDTVGDAVKDAKGNKICWHKCGDLLRQAAAYLS